MKNDLPVGQRMLVSSSLLPSTWINKWTDSQESTRTVVLQQPATNLVVLVRDNFFRRLGGFFEVGLEEPNTVLNKLVAVR